jgi:hypothetical protein
VKLSGYFTFGAAQLLASHGAGVLKSAFHIGRGRSELVAPCLPLTNDKYPYLLDTSGSAAGSYWDRSAPNAFNLDNLSGAVTVNQPLTSGGFAPGADHLIIRAFGTSVPEPSTFVLCGLAIPAALALRRRSQQR